MTTPTRLQLSRKKGFNLQEWSRATNGLACVVVARPTKWGNPFIAMGDWDRRMAVIMFKACMTLELPIAIKGLRDSGFSEKIVAPVRALRGQDLTALRGKNLACWCALDQPCHADVLLELANK
jgi:Domain of unknown function (DUF4326)